jgi:hypothetical protein
MFDFFMDFFRFYGDFWDFLNISNFCLTLTHTHILTYTHSYRHILTHIRLKRIERVIVSIRYNGCRGLIMHLELVS